MKQLDRATDFVLPSDQDATGRTLGEEECSAVNEAIRSGTLTCTKGRFTKQFEKDFAAMLGVKHAVACSSGTAAVHVAVAAINPEPGAEIITSPITDMGAIAPILYQGAIPVFADVDPLTANVTAETIAARFSDRTKAIIVTHLFGNPCEMELIKNAAAKRGIPVIEDCAQAFLASSGGSYVGTIGNIGCFSLQQGKHITTGEGGLVVTNDDALARHMYLFVNKAWGYGDPNPDHYFLALNYRLSELQGAVALAQLPKLRSVVEARTSQAARLTSAISDLPGLTTPVVQPNDHCVYWRYVLHIDASKIAGGTQALGAKLKARGIMTAPRYIQKPAFRCEVFREQRTFGQSKFPFTLARPEAVDYAAERFPGTFRALETILVLPWTERFTDAHVDYIAECIRDAVAELGEK